MPMITVALDAMGGDHAPASTVQGALEALARFPDLHVILVGGEAPIRRHLRGAYDAARVTIEHTTEVVGMDGDAAELRQKQASSIVRCAELVRDGKAQAMVGAGNTAAAVGAARLSFGRLEGVRRPGIAVTFPTVAGHPCVVIDCGASVDCKAGHLAQFAVMGSVYAERVLGMREPRVGLLSIGEEEAKGNDLTREAFPLLREAPLRFLGNAEGRDVFNGKFDVVVCDGFVGNVMLKAAEGLGEGLGQILREELSRGVFNRLGAFLALPGLRGMKRRIDYAEYGGMPLLGVKGGCLIAHGRSNPMAIRNALRAAREFVQADVNRRIVEGVAKLKAEAGVGNGNGEDR